ncbi:glycosyltransferase [Conexibacter sp. SYSU D00693]|uniref:glycosyltransferase family 2 protein n=1 Tax=Conexibacter sp. SYSU D00693 TaxID=2812560 RepID=UPI00196AE465|nr:glycosyltransferase family 2 protein [Conexibacter sp. SYSU D00693]
MKDLLLGIVDQPPYLALMAFLAWYPVVTALYWIVGSLVFWRHRERHDDGFYELDHHPFVSVLVAAHDEEALIGKTVERLLALDWPAFEVVVVDDGSRDRTAEVLRPYARDGRIRLVHKERNEGKAMALNDALPLLRGEIVLMVDADGQPRPDVLRWMVPHFVKVPRLAAVTGNPRVLNTTTLLGKLQAIEFTATVSVLRRAQATWGRLMTFSGISTALRRSAIERAGRFPADMATEDIALAWELQATFSDVRYEPRAVFGMQVPETLGTWWKQRTRWGTGLGQVLRRHSGLFGDWRKRRLWPVYVEAVLSSVWALSFVVAVVVWLPAYAWGAYTLGANPVPNFWGMVLASVLVVQIALGMWLDGRYDPGVRRYALWMPIYPLVYWVLMAAASARSTIPGFLRRPDGGPVRWTSAPRLGDASSPPERRGAGDPGAYSGAERRRAG